MDSFSIFFYVFIYSLLLVVEDRASDTIKILLSDTGHSSATVLALLNNLHLLELDEDRSDNTGVGLLEVLGADTALVGATVPLAELTYAKSRAEVDLAGDGSGTDVVPVIAVGGELLVAGGLDEVGPDGELELVGVLEVLSVGGDEVASGNVTDADSTGFVFSHFELLYTKRGTVGLCVGRRGWRGWVRYMLS